MFYGKHTILMAIFHGHFPWPFSIAMLVITRGYRSCWRLQTWSVETISWSLLRALGTISAPRKNPFFNIWIENMPCQQNMGHRPLQILGSIIPYPQRWQENTPSLDELSSFKSPRMIYIYIIYICIYIYIIIRRGGSIAIHREIPGLYLTSIYYYSELL